MNKIIFYYKLIIKYNLYILMENNYNELINLLKEIFNKGLKNGAYNIDDANNFIETIKNIEILLSKENEKKFIDPIDYLDNIV